MPKTRNQLMLNITDSQDYPNDAFYRSLFNLANDGIILIRGDKFYDCNQRALEMLRLSREEVIGLRPWDISPTIQPDGQKSETKGRNYLSQGYSGEPQKFQWDHIAGDGSLVTIEVSLSLIPDADEPYLLCHWRDISDRLRTEAALSASEDKYFKAFRASPSAILLLRIRDRLVLEVNKAFEEMTGYLEEEVTGRGLEELGLLLEKSLTTEFVEQFHRDGSIRSHESMVGTKSGAILDCWTSTAIIDVSGEPSIIVHIQDVTESKAAIEALEYQANHDTLTDLPNRSFLRKQIEQTIMQQNADRAGIVLMIMDLNQFKEINDTLGHHTGDLLLQQIGPRLQPILTGQETQIARLGGDEFALLHTGLQDEQQTINAVKNIFKALDAPFEVAGILLNVRASIGIARYPDQGEDANSLLRCADIALYVAKEESKGFAFYQPDQDYYSIRRLTLMNDLHTAIAEDQLFLHYQPKIDTKNRKLKSFEALVRWQHPEHGLIPPGQFVPLAELGESIHAMSNWVVKNAIRQIAEWQRQGFDVTVAVNLSTRNLMDERCAKQLEWMLETQGVSPDRLEIEITESALIHDPDRAMQNLDRIHSTGVKLSIDDFGTGYSSMSYLKQMPIDTLKIDMVFVQHMAENPKDALMVKSTINLAHNLGLTVVAEGVENEETLNMLSDMGCDSAQGYYISKPLPSELAGQWSMQSNQG